MLWACTGLGYPGVGYETSSPRQLLDRGLGFLDAGRTDSALYYFTLAQTKYDEALPDSSLHACAAAACNAGYVYLYEKLDYVAAYGQLLQALKIAQKSGDEEIITTAHLNIAGIYMAYDDNENGLKHYREAWRGAAQERRWEKALTAITSMMNIANQDKGRHDISAELRKFDSLPIPAAPMLAYARTMRRATAVLQDQRWEEARQLIEQARSQVDASLTPEHYRWGCDIMIADIWARQGAPDKEIETFKAIAAEGERLGELDVQYQAARRLGEIYEGEQRPDSALKYIHAATLLRDSLFSKQQYSTIRDLSSNFELASLQGEIDDINGRRRALSAALWISIAAVLVLLGFGAFYFVMTRRMRAANRALYSRNADIMAQRDQERRMREAYEARIEELENPQEKAEPRRAPALDEFARQSLLARIEKVLDDVQAISRKEFSITELADLVGSNRNYVSQVINDSYGKSFSSLLSDRRVREACVRLKDAPRYGRYTVEAIAEGLGFKSRSNFAAVFKKVTGLTPTDYRRMSGQ